MIDLEPGEIYTFSVTVSNPVNSAEDFNYKAYAAPYSVANMEYDADVVTKTDRTRMADWINILEPTGVIAPNETKEIEFTITVPENAPGGGQYAAIVVGADKESDIHSNVAVANVLEIASILYAKVDGEIVHKGEVLENNVPGFLVESPIAVSSLIINEGNMHEVANILITASNVFTGETIASAELDNGVYAELIMPDSQKFVSKEIDELLMMGIVNVKQSIHYNGTVSTVEKNVIICPIWFLALVLVTVSAIMIKIAKTVRKHQKKKKKLAQKELVQ